MASNVSNTHLDKLYDSARAAGAEGGKVCGAGAGGCLLLFAGQRHHAAIRAAMLKEGLRELRFGIEPEGTRIIHFSN